MATQNSDFRVKNGLIVEGDTITFKDKQLQHLLDSADTSAIAAEAAAATAIALAIALG